MPACRGCPPAYGAPDCELRSGRWAGDADRRARKISAGEAGDAVCTASLFCGSVETERALSSAARSADFRTSSLGVISAAAGEIGARTVSARAETETGAGTTERADSG